MSRNALAAALVVVICAVAFAAALSRTDDAFWLIAAGVVGLIALAALFGIYVLDVSVRAGKAARDIGADKRSA